MARQEEPRENLLAEATALVDRAELTVPHETEPVVVGFRREGAASFFFGEDPVYQFTSQGALRRAFVDGLLYKAVDGQLASMTRVRTGSEVQLVRHDLAAQEHDAFLATAATRLKRLRDALTRADFELTGEVTTAGSPVDRAIEFLGGLSQPLVVAKSPRVQ